jgi:hypothetical protein
MTWQLSLLILRSRLLVSISIDPVRPMKAITNLILAASASPPPPSLPCHRQSSTRSPSLLFRGLRRRRKRRPRPPKTSATSDCIGQRKKGFAAFTDCAVDRKRGGLRGRRRHKHDMLTSSSSAAAAAEVLRSSLRYVYVTFAQSHMLTPTLFSTNKCNLAK